MVAIYGDGQRQGTGFVVGSNGYIMTALHVVGTISVTPQNTFTVSYRPNLEVVLSDGSRFAAQAVDNPDPKRLCMIPSC